MMMRVIAATVSVFVASVAFAGAPPKAAAPKEKSLYDRLGGGPAIAVVVDEFLNKLVADPVITANPKVAEATGKVPAAYLKWQITTQMCAVTGGPCKYTGRDMKETHKNLGITEKEWDASVADLVSVLDAHKVPQKEKDELLKIIGTTKKDIVTGGPGTTPSAPVGTH